MPNKPNVGYIPGMDDEQYKLLVAGNVLFLALDEAVREEVIKLARVVTYSKGE